MADVGWLQVAGAAAVVAFVYLMVKLGGPGNVFKMVARRYLRQKDEHVEAPPGTVLLYQFNRGTWTPNVSPFCLKLETYLRMAGIPYKNVHGIRFGSKQRMPWIQYNGETVADSELCISYLKKKTGVDLNKGVSKDKLAAAHGFLKMVDESIFRYYVTHLWVHRENLLALDSMGPPRLLQLYISRKWRLVMASCGYSEFTEEESDKMLDDDLRSLSDYLGKSNFVLGANPTDIDSALFGLLYNLKVYFDGSPAQRLMEDKYKNINEYLERIKERFWPDWDECITHGATRDATK